ncbi:hypothetical protein [Microvirga lotononidis]|uniref:hypothetical protein n=1 Tax=Microvirga lotononidis TaxID=864069 RepID=UPI0012B648FF|nr:hypothetical protein [Microvirga lotononidis]WQO31618.1 hypothetical protein U0023_30055 [Microvirga lotononidis]
MKLTLTYCTARMFSMGLLPMVAISVPEVVAGNDNDWQVPSPAPWGWRLESH